MFFSMVGRSGGKWHSIPQDVLGSDVLVVSAVMVLLNVGGCRDDRQA